MQAYEMNNKAKSMINEKFAHHFGEPKPVADRFGSYDEAKAAAEAAAKEGRNDRNAQIAMIAYKKNTFNGAARRAQIDRLGLEYEAMSITDIQSQLKAAIQEKEELNRYLDKLFDAEAKKVYKEARKAGVTLESAIDDFVEDRMKVWVKETASFCEAQAQYNQVDIKVIALRSAIDAFKVRNKDLIEAAAEEKRKAEVQAYLASLEESSEEG